MSEAWRSYEEVAAYLLDQMAEAFGLEEVEGKQLVAGSTSGTTYEIDAKGAFVDGRTFIIIECRRRTTRRVTQEEIAALAYRIHDTGAQGGIVVAPLGLQVGARKVAAAENIHSVTLDPDSTRSDYVLSFLNGIHVGVSDRVVFQDKAVAVIRNASTGEAETID